MRREYAAVFSCPRLIHRLQNDRARAVAEQNASAAILPVENARESFRADHECRVERAGAQILVGSRKREDETRAYRLHVERRALLDAEFGLNRDRCRGESLVGRRGREHDQVDFARVHFGVSQGSARSLQAEMRSELAFGRDMPLANAGALLDPRVAGVDRLRKLVIGDHALRQISADTTHDRMADTHDAVSLRTAELVTGAAAI